MQRDISPTTKSLSRFAWWPLPLLFLATPLLHHFVPLRSFESTSLLVVLNFLCTTLPACFIASLIALTFLQAPSPRLLMFGSGVLVMGLGGFVAAFSSVVGSPHSANITVTVHNCSMLLAAILHFLGVTTDRRRRLSHPKMWLVVLYTSSSCAVACIAIVTLIGIMPPFFVPATGGTPIRQLLLGGSIALFFLTAFRLWQINRAAYSAFRYWYSLALGLFGIGLSLVMIEHFTGDITSWIGRSTQYLACFYMLFAAIMSARETGTWRIPVRPVDHHEIVSTWDEWLLRILAPRLALRSPFWKYIVTLLVVVLATFFRWAFIPIIGTQAPYNFATLACILVAVVLGTGPGVFSAFTSYAAVEVFIIESYPFFQPDLARYAAQTIMCLIVVLIIRAIRIAQTKASSSDARLLAFSSATFEGIYEAQKGHIIECNEQFANMLGYKPYDLTGKAVAQIIAPEDRERVMENFELNREATTVHTLVCADGRRITVEARGRPIALESLSKGTVQTHYTAVHDITHLKQIETRLIRSNEELEAKIQFRTDELSRERVRLYEVLETLPAMICLITVDHRVVFLNKAFRDRFGESLGRPCYEYVFGNKSPCEFCEAFRCLTTGSPHRWEVDLPQHGMVFSVTNVPFIDADGTRCVLQMNIDITEQRRNQEQLKRLNLELNEAKENAIAESLAKTRFLRTVSHELRTPLNGVIGSLELLEDTTLGPDQLQFVRMARASGSTLLNLVNDLLDIAKMEQGKIELIMRQFDLHQCVNDVDASIRPSAITKGLAVDFKLPATIPKYVIGDGDRLKQVLLNLVGNAVKFTPTGNIDVSLTEMKRTSSIIDVRFTVRDTGIGIPLNDRQIIFEPFIRSANAQILSAGGTGLGLAIASQIVRLMGGAVTVESEVGKGSEFSFSIPFRLP